MQPEKENQYVNWYYKNGVINMKGKVLSEYHKRRHYVEIMMNRDELRWETCTLTCV